MSPGCKQRQPVVCQQSHDRDELLRSETFLFAVVVWVAEKSPMYLPSIHRSREETQQQYHSLALLPTTELFAPHHVPEIDAVAIARLMEPNMPLYAAVEVFLGFDTCQTKDRRDSDNHRWKTWDTVPWQFLLICMCFPRPCFARCYG